MAIRFGDLCGNEVLDSRSLAGDAAAVAALAERCGELLGGHKGLSFPVTLPEGGSAVFSLESKEGGRAFVISLDPGSFDGFGMVRLGAVPGGWGLFFPPAARPELVVMQDRAVTVAARTDPERVPDCRYRPNLWRDRT